MLILECSQGCHGRTDGRKDGRTEGWKDGRKDGRTDGRTEGRTDGSVTISLRNFVGKGIIILSLSTTSSLFECSRKKEVPRCEIDYDCCS
jgi:hypothetical protein